MVYPWGFKSLHPHQSGSNRNLSCFFYLYILIIVLDDLAACNVIVNESGMFLIVTDDYIIRTRLDYNKNMVDSNFNINAFLKEMFARNFSYKKNV